MGKITAYIDGIKTSFIALSPLPDRLEPNQTFSITLAGKNVFPSTSQGQVYIELYKDDTELLGIGRLASEVENLGIRPKTIINCVDQTGLLDYQPITKHYEGAWQFVVEQIVMDGGSSGLFSGISFKVDPDLLTLPTSIDIDGFTSTALTQVLTQTGKPLKYRCKLNERLLQIFQLGYASRLAPIPEIDLDLWTAGQKKYQIKDLVVEKINPQYSVIRVEGLNYKDRPSDGSTSKTQYRVVGANSGQNAYPLPGSAYKLTAIRITSNLVAPETLCPYFNVTGSFSGDDNLYSLIETNPKYRVISNAGIKIETAKDTLTFPVSKTGGTSISLDLTNLDYANVPTLTLSIASGINVTSFEYNPLNVRFTNIIDDTPAVVQVFETGGPPSQIIDLLNDLDFYFEYNNQLYDNVTKEIILDIAIPQYAGFPADPTFFMRFTAGVFAQFTGEVEPSPPGYIRVKFSRDGGGTIFDSNTQSNGVYTTSLNAESFRGSFIRYRLQVSIHRPSNDYFFRPNFTAFGDVDRTLTFDFPDPPDDPPTVTATQKVFVNENQVISLVYDGTNVGGSYGVDLKPYAGQIVEISTQTTTNIDQISNYIVVSQAVTTIYVDCTDANGPGGGGSGSGS